MNAETLRKEVVATLEDLRFPVPHEVYVHQASDGSNLKTVAKVETKEPSPPPRAK